MRWRRMFVTVWLGVLELSTGKLTAANAGHEYPVIKSPNGRFELFKDKHGLVIGAMDGGSWWAAVHGVSKSQT